VLDTGDSSRVEAGGDFSRGEVKVKSPTSQGKTKFKIDSLRVAPTTALPGAALRMGVVAERFWQKFEADSTFQDDGATKRSKDTYTSKFLNVAPQIAWMPSAEVGLGVGYEHFQETIDSTLVGEHKVELSRLALGGRWRSSLATLDFGFRNEAATTKKLSKTTTVASGGSTTVSTSSVEESRYLPNETYVKATCDVDADLAWGMMLKFFDYNRKKEESSYRHVKLQATDRLGLALQATYMPRGMVSIQGILRHEAAVDVARPARGLIANDGVEVNAVLRPADAWEVGAQVGYATGHTKWKLENPEDGPSGPTLDLARHNVGLWAAARF